MAIPTVEIVSKAVSELAKEYNFKEVYLYGSCARGDNTEESDVDLLVVFDTVENDDWKSSASFDYDMEHSFGLPSETRRVSTIHNQEFIDNVREDMIMIWPTVERKSVFN